MKIVKELDRAFEILNSHLFLGALRVPGFFLDPKKKNIFKFIPETYQIQVGGDLTKVDGNALLAHLLHEMVHISNYSNGIIDCRSNQYHNKEFKIEALRVGLVCVKRRNHGWITTIIPPTGEVSYSPPKDIINNRVKAFNEVKLDKAILNQTKIEFGDIGKRNRHSIYFLKYECKCPPPHNSIRSGRRPDGDYPLHIRCMDCKTLFTCVDV